MTSFQQQKHTAGHGVSYEIINNFCVSEPKPIDLKSKLKRNYLVVCYLSLVAILSFGSVFTFSALMKRFHSSHCFVGTKFKFTHNGTGEVILLRNQLDNHSDSDPLYSDVQIDRHETLWNSLEHCDYVLYPLVVLGLSAIIWAAIFYACSMTDRNNKSLLPSPWRIVLPAVVYFMFMAIVSIYYACRSHSVLRGTCDNLMEAFDRNSTGPACSDLIDHFSISGGNVKSSVIYYVFLSCSYSAMSLWIFLSLLMLLRCILGTDFDQTQLEIKPLQTDPPRPETEEEQRNGD